MLSAPSAGTAQTALEDLGSPSSPCTHVKGAKVDADLKGLGRQLWGEIETGERLDHAGRPASGLPYGLAQGIVGVAGDEHVGFSVVVDTDVISQKQMEARLDRALPSPSRRFVDVSPSCNDAASLAKAWNAVHQVDWASHAEGARIGIHLDADKERVVVESVAADLIRPGLLELGSEVSELVEIAALESMSRTGRVNDEPRWHGGLRIKRGNGSICSGGFTVVRRSNGRRAMVTAGHCGRNGITWRNGRDNDFVGTSAARSDYPEYDQELLVARV